MWYIFWRRLCPDVIQSKSAGWSDHLAQCDRSFGFKKAWLALSTRLLDQRIGLIHDSVRRKRVLPDWIGIGVTWLFCFSLLFIAFSSLRVDSEWRQTRVFCRPMFFNAMSISKYKLCHHLFNQFAGLFEDFSNFLTEWLFILPLHCFSFATSGA